MVGREFVLPVVVCAVAEAVRLLLDAQLGTGISELQSLLSSTTAVVPTRLVAGFLDR